MPAHEGNDYAKGNSGGGRPSEYQQSHCKLVYKLALLGATDSEIADIFEVSEQTINNWKKQYPEFYQSMMRGKVQADAEVAESLFKRAVGFEFDEVTFEKIDSKTALEVTSAGEIKDDDTYKKKVVTKIIVGDVAAQNIWLKNRRHKVKEGGQKWADKHETELTGKDGNPIMFLPAEKLTQDQIEGYLKKHVSDNDESI